MRIWIDLGNSPHVPFFVSLSKELTGRGHEILWTARDYAQTVELAHKAGLNPSIFGRHGGKNIFSKLAKFVGRVFALRAWARTKKIDLVLSHNSHEPLVVARWLNIESVNLMDYEHHPANHLSFRLARKLIVPKSFPAESLRKFGADEKKIRRFVGIKEDVYLSDFEPDRNFSDELSKLGISRDEILIIVRPHAPEALYHRGILNELLDVAIDKFASTNNTKIILLPRKENQRRELRERHPQKNIIVPERVLDGANLIAAADLVVSGGGTMNREAAALGIPTATIFSGPLAAIDEYLFREGRLQKIETLEDLERLPIKKKIQANPRRETNVRGQIVDFILENSH